MGMINEEIGEFRKEFRDSTWNNLKSIPIQPLEAIKKIDILISSLKSEVDQLEKAERKFFFFSNSSNQIKIKHGKIQGMEELRGDILSGTSVSSATLSISNKYPKIREGFFSCRTDDLLRELEHGKLVYSN